MHTEGLHPASLAHIRGQGLIQIELEPTRESGDHLVYRLRGASGVFLCGPEVQKAELEELHGSGLTFFGYGRSELGLYTLTADVWLADVKSYPRVSLRVAGLHEVRVIPVPELQASS